MTIIISPLCLLHQDLEKTYIFVSLLRSLQHDYDKKTLFWFYRCVDYAAIIRFFFIYFDTTFTTPCSRWKTFFISVFCSLRHGDRKNKFNLYYITALTTVDHEKKHSFIWSYFYVLPWSKKKKTVFHLSIAVTVHTSSYISYIYQWSLRWFTSCFSSLNTSS